MYVFIGDIMAKEITYEKTLYEKLTDNVLDELYSGTPLNELKEIVAGLVAEGYLQHKDVVDALTHYKKEHKIRISLLKQMYEDLKEGYVISANAKEFSYRSMKETQDVLERYTKQNPIVRKIEETINYRNPGSAA